jgi:hypothetical protein
VSRYAEGAIPQIHIIVNNGKVTLYGIVDNQTNKELAALRANTVAGVFSVIDYSSIEPDRQRKRQPAAVKAAGGLIICMYPSPEVMVAEWTSC